MHRLPLIMSFSTDFPLFVFSNIFLGELFPVALFNNFIGNFIKIAWTFPVRCNQKKIVAHDGQNVYLLPQTSMNQSYSWIVVNNKTAKKELNCHFKSLNRTPIHLWSYSPGYIFCIFFLHVHFLLWFTKTWL